MNSPTETATNLEGRVQMPESRSLRLLGLIPILGVAAVAYTITHMPPTSPETLALRAFQAKYSDVRSGIIDVNKDGQYEYGISFRNIKGELEQWVYDTDNGQRVLKRVAEVKDGNIVYDRTIFLD